MLEQPSATLNAFLYLPSLLPIFCGCLLPHGTCRWCVVFTDCYTLPASVTPSVDATVPCFYLLYFKFSLHFLFSCFFFFFFFCYLPLYVSSIVNTFGFCFVYGTLPFLSDFIGVIGYFDRPEYLFDPFPNAFIRSMSPLYFIFV
jgi:hypothetical protein